VIVPAVGGLASKLSESLINNAAAPHAGGLAQGGQSGLSLSNTGLEGNLGAGGPEGTSGVEGAGGIGGGGVEGVGGVESPNFGSQLTNAISTLESTQRSGDSAAQSLASGTATDPESAVVTVQDAQMAMDLAATIRTKATEAAQSIFQTQV
jgi:flagellar hook-basal body complex protein FliE